MSGGNVEMKIVAGCDGCNARILADRLEAIWPVSPDAAYELAQQLDFGGQNDRVVITKSEIRYDGDEEPNSLYRETFSQPSFNPRWERGTSDYTVVIEV